MRFIRSPWVYTGAIVFGMSIAACSSKSNDDAGAGGTTGSGGAPSTATGGATHTGGGSSSLAGSTAFDPETYCDGLFKGKSCSQTQREADVRTVNMLLVLDESGSMNQPPAPGQPSKWTIMKSALQTALTKVQDDIDFGLLLFPYLEGGIPADSTNTAVTCAVPTEVADAVNVPIGEGAIAVQDVLAKVDIQTPAGGTPTARALKQAYNYFTIGEGKDRPGTKWVLLATDGGPNCNAGLTCSAAACTYNIEGSCATGNCCEGDKDRVACLDEAAVRTQIQALALVGVKTFVIGIPGSDAYATYLDEFAVDGQMPNKDSATGEKYYAISAASAQQDLIDAFGSITTQLIKSCDIALKNSPPDPNKVTVAIDCAKVLPVPAGAVADAGDVDGYYIDYSQKPAHIKFVGPTCSGLAANGAHHVDVIVGCSGLN